MRSIRQKRIKEICKQHDKYEAVKQISKEGLCLSRAEARRIVDRVNNGLWEGIEDTREK
jgi:hypothetical protein